MRSSPGFAIAASFLTVTWATVGWAADDRSCEAWAALKIDEQKLIVGSMLEQRAGPPESSRLAGCLWSLFPRIIDHTTESCLRDHGSYVPALRKALDTAAGFCESKGGAGAPSGH